MKNNLLFMQRLLMVFVLLLFCTISAHAQDWNQIIKATAGDRNKLTATPRLNGTSYGREVGLSGNYAFAGTTEGLGTIYISKYSDGKWTQIQRIPSPESNGFSSSLSVSGDYFIAASDNGAYVYKKNTGADSWSLVRKIITVNPNFEGITVAISGNHAIVGISYSSYEEPGGNSLINAGSAFIFEKDRGGTDNWGQLKVITAAVPKTYDGFGKGVAVSDDHIIVGSTAGAAVFQQNKGGTNNWGQVQYLTNSTTNQNIENIRRIAISGNYAVIGVPYDDLPEAGQGDNLTNAGSAYIFKKEESTDNWVQIQKITATEPYADSNFGSAVAINGGIIAVGASSYNQNNGIGYIFEMDPVTPDHWGAGIIMDPVGGSYFGSSVAVNDDFILAGAPGYNIDYDIPGVVCVYQKDRNGTNSWELNEILITMRILPEDQFGYRVAINGNYAVIGVPYEDMDADGLGYVGAAGAAYIFFNNSGNWQQVKKITAPVRVENAIFGFSVAIDNDYIIVGAPFPNPQVTEGNIPAGSAYVFQKDEGGVGNWGLVKQLALENTDDNVQFSFSVSISGNYAVVGAPIETSPILPEALGLNAGSVYVFEKNIGGDNNWGMLKKVVNILSKAGDHFGSAVSISGDYFMASAPDEDEDALETNTITSSGSVYVFQKDSGGPDQWGQIKKITSAARLLNEQFGYSLSLNGNYAIISTYNGNGSATIFRRNMGGVNNWGQVKKLIRPGTANEFFGRSVSMSGDFAVVGAGAASIDGMTNAGAAYLYSKDEGGPDQWGLIKKLTASVPTAGDQFGYAAAISGSSIIIGAPSDDEDASEANPLSNAGSIYIIRDGSPLPVTLAMFEATKNENTALLQWTTSAETNTDHFEILRSTDAKSWEILGHVEAAKESTQLLSYTFTDHKPAAGENFYRLKMVDRAADRLDGTFTYSRIRNVSFDINGNITLYPNPVSEKLFLTDTEPDKIESVSIINVSGQTVLQVSKFTKEGITINQLSAGMYLVQVRKKNGTVQMNKVIISR